MSKITDLADASLPLDDTDLFEVVQDVAGTPVNRKVPASELAGGGGAPSGWTGYVYATEDAAANEHFGPTGGGSNSNNWYSGFSTTLTISAPVVVDSVFWRVHTVREYTLSLDGTQLGAETPASSGEMLEFALGGMMLSPGTYNLALGGNASHYFVQQSSYTDGPVKFNGWWEVNSGYYPICNLWGKAAELKQLS